MDLKMLAEEGARSGSALCPAGEQEIVEGLELALQALRGIISGMSELVQWGARGENYPFGLSHWCRHLKEGHIGVSPRVKKIARRQGGKGRVVGQKLICQRGLECLPSI